MLVKIVAVIGFMILTTVQGVTQNNLFHGRNRPSPRFLYATSVKNNIGDNFSDKVLQLFKAADRNSNKKISVAELQVFQFRLVRNYRYQQNKTALHPNDFVEQGGGDCEDFALMTTCMLNYYGVVAYVASFGRVTTNKHSLCMVKTATSVPPGYLYYTLTGYGVPIGTYIPVDYDKIGGLKAIDRRWKIARMVRPKQIIGKIW